jgi:hypothetical protein
MELMGVLKKFKVVVLLDLIWEMLLSIVNS